MEEEEKVEAEQSKKMRRTCGEEQGRSPLSPSSLSSSPLSSSILLRPSRPPCFASSPPPMTPLPPRYSFLLPPGPGAAFERIAERAEVLRKPGDGCCCCDDETADELVRLESSWRGTSWGAATRTETAAVDAATRAITATREVRMRGRRA